MKIVELPRKLPQTQMRLLEDLERRIQNGIWRENDFVGSELSLSREFQVSRTTLRTVLALLEEQQILRRVPRQGLQLCESFQVQCAQGGKRKKVLLIRLHDDALLGDIATGLLRVAAGQNLAVEQLCVNGSLSVLCAILDSLTEAYHTVLLLPVQDRNVEAALARLQARGVQVLQLDRQLEQLNAPAIVFDNYRGGLLATRQLLEENCRGVYFFGYRSPSSVRQRFEGWRDAMREAGFGDWERFLLCPMEGEIFPETNRAEMIRKAENAVRQLLEEHHGRLAIFAVNDALAELVYRAVAPLKLRIGRDVLVTGFDDLEMCKHLVPPLSSVSVPREALGEAAGMLAAEKWNTLNFNKILDVKLVVRESSQVERKNKF